MSGHSNGKKESYFSSVLWGTAAVSVIALLGKLLGFAREALIADYFGATWRTDAFFFAQNMPGMIFPSVCNSVSTAFISLYTAKLAQETERDADRYASRMLMACMMLGLALSGVGMAAAPLLVPLFAPGFQGEQLALAGALTRLTMGAFALTMAQYMLGAVLNSKKRFIGFQAAGLLYNAVIIAATVLLGRGQSMETLTWMVILGHAAQAVMLVLCCRGCFHPVFRASPFHRDTARLLRLSLPILLGNAAYQINTIVDQALGSLLPDGSLSALSYAHTLTFLVTSVCIASLSTVLYPTLTADAAKGDQESYGKRLSRSLTGLCALMIPISFLTLLCAGDIVAAVYARGSFNQTAVSYTGAALSGYALMFISTGIREILTRAFYARQDTRTPMINTVISIGCNVVFSILLVRRLGVAGIALGTTLAGVIAACLLLRDVGRKMPFVRLSGFFSQLWRQLAAGLALCAGVLAFRQVITPPSFPLLRFALDTFLGFAVYLAALAPLGGLKTLRQFLRR